ncbi:Uncharacterised protein [Bordetella pertussis]|nr:Uncharacterised protein [Bordetella pertussis]CPM69971.1 Uncharacterised protein [Bordetella pertussis]
MNDCIRCEAGSSRSLRRYAVNGARSRTGRITKPAPGQLRAENSSTSATPAPAWTSAQVFCGDPTSITGRAATDCASNHACSFWPNAEPRS